MRGENNKRPSQYNKQATKKKWLWPALYVGIAVFFVGMIWGYSAFMQQKDTDLANVAKPDEDVTVEANAPSEVLKYPFDETLLDDIAILQNFYDVEADDSMRENALLVFNQTYETSTGVSISIEDKPFDVVAARSGIIEDVVQDAFQGDEVVISHADGMKTVYSSLSGVRVQVGDEVEQGDYLGDATSNEWNPAAGTHLHFKVLVDDQAVNPESYLGF
ncbi:MAG TPA: M23 family metallopeptidase [Sporosarcina sp.]|nr:M23 family metallopeptidase [Sporosarcina sp.]